MKTRSFVTKLYFIFLFLISSNLLGQANNPLKIISTKEVSQIEVGGPFVGIEIHKSFPMINRISFYYPVANSIDISEDYWKRENYRIMSMGLKVGDSPKFMLEDEVWTVVQTPYNVKFSKDTLNSGLNINYEFCLNQPAMCAQFIVKNNSATAKLYEIYIRYEADLRTSHTYNTVLNSSSDIYENGKLISFNYDVNETGHSQIFFYNVGEQPNQVQTNYVTSDTGDPNEHWLNDGLRLNDNELHTKPGAVFVYKKELKPGDSLSISQLIGSVKINEAGSVIDDLEKNYKKEISDYEKYILNSSIEKKAIKTGNQVFDFTTNWALAVLAANAHYIDSIIVPMPAQAEYNFYFTHDALLTDLAAVNFDLSRVKNDLQFIIKHADQNNVIPHAYYWKDDKFKTEYAGTENWNHFWFTILAARYLRHSDDNEFAKVLYPYVKQSIDTALKNKENNLMYSFRPDWWDIGNNYGPRAYMTILAIKALREFNYFSAEVNMKHSEKLNYNSIADTLHKYLIEKLWNADLKYLTSFYQDGTEDKHIYMGSMLASHFELLDDKKNMQHMETAKKYLLDDNLGVYTLFPMDLHKLGDYLGFAGNEAGQPFYYANGGVWPHGNAWYVLSLISNDKNDEAYEFIKKIMTINGVMNSPNGQPSMYEYRISDKSNPELYGQIDKPQFLWAGGWYLYSLYNLFGLRENDWNISFEPYLPDKMSSLVLSITLKGKLVPVEISGSGRTVSSFKVNDIDVPSVIVPRDYSGIKNLKINLGKTLTPYLNNANAKVYSPKYNAEEKLLEFGLEAAADYQNKFEIISPTEIEYIYYNNIKLSDNIILTMFDGLYKIKVNHLVTNAYNNYSIMFK